MTERSNVLAAALLSLGVVVGAGLLGAQLAGSRTADRFVTVKGLAERDVDADLALWSFQLVATANDLDRAQNEIATSARLVREFLARHGVDSAGLSVQGVQVTDRLAQQYGGQRDPSDLRYVVQQGMILRSEDPEAVHAASQGVGELVDSGVVMVSGTGYGPALPSFLFEALNDLKPEMIAEATSSAREAAERFAEDSGSRLGGIRRANQGVFVIQARDEAPGVVGENQLRKTVRIVSTIEYYLED